MLNVVYKSIPPNYELTTCIETFSKLFLKTSNRFEFVFKKYFEKTVRKYTKIAMMPLKCKMVSYKNGMVPKIISLNVCYNLCLPRHIILLIYSTLT